MRFYDPLLRIVAWFEDINAGPVSGVAFSLALPDKVRSSANPELNLGRNSQGQTTLNTTTGSLRH